MKIELEKDEGKDPKPARPASGALYQPAVALEFFKSAGKAESIAQGKSIFVEDERSGGMFSGGTRMYLLLEGEVELSVRKKVIGAVGKGEIFGEMASISQLPRTATATARTACSVISLDEKQFSNAIGKSPEFALMLMNIIISRLRETIVRLSGGGALSEKDRWNKATVFDRKLLEDLQRELEDKPAAHHPMNKAIMKEGEKGMFMYVVLEGTVAVAIGGKVVEKVGPGGVFGEMALVDQSPRAASATAEEDCTLLAINRVDFLNLVKTRPAFAASLLKALAERLRFMTAKYK
ncbi:MAG: cyclic nucleotide-binding domain-containing protein [Betaproteobacteria bacterium]|nr:cyclic nucleotide-binding domain-containing protein [Betaproteobacteria bacterium]